MVVVIITGKKSTMQGNICILAQTTVIFLILNLNINIFVLNYLEGMVNLIYMNVFEQVQWECVTIGGEHLGHQVQSHMGLCQVCHALWEKASWRIAN